MSIRGGEARDLIDRFGERCGWNDDSKIDLLCDYINNQQSGDALQDFLQQQADEEASYGDDFDDDLDFEDDDDFYDDGDDD